MLAIAFTVITDSCAVGIGLIAHALLVGAGDDFASLLGSMTNVCCPSG